MRVTVHIPTASAWLPERVATLDRLLAQLEKQDCRPVVHRSMRREHASVWAVRVYEAVAAEDPDCAIILNDDVQVAPDLIAAIHAVLQNPRHRLSRFLSLHAVHPMSRSLAEAGQRYFSTFHVTGPAYCHLRGTSREILAYYKEAPKAWTSKLHEDNVQIQLAFRHREPVLNLIPALVVHDESVPSSLGFDSHPNRVTKVPWTDPLFEGVDLTKGWEVPAQVPFMETHWTQTQTLLSQEISNDLGVAPEACWHCLERPAFFGSEKSGARMCGKCLSDAVNGCINEAMKNAMAMPRQQ